MAANIGSAATITGNPKNMMIGGFSGISYRHFLAVLAPPEYFRVGAPLSAITILLGAAWIAWRIR